MKFDIIILCFNKKIPGFFWKFGMQLHKKYGLNFFTFLQINLWVQSFWNFPQKNIWSWDFFFVSNQQNPPQWCHSGCPPPTLPSPSSWAPSPLSRRSHWGGRRWCCPRRKAGGRKGHPDKIPVDKWNDNLRFNSLLRSFLFYIVKFKRRPTKPWCSI